MAKKRAQQAQETKKLIVDTAQKLVAERGYDQVTVSDITKACGISTGTMYHYFKGKDAIFTYIERGRFDDLAERIDNMAFPCIDEKIRFFLVEWFQNIFADSINLSSNWYRMTLAGQLPAEREGNHFSDDIASVTRYLREAVDAGELQPDTPVDFIATNLVFSINGATFYRCIDCGDFDYKAWANSFVEPFIAILITPFKA